MLYLSREALTDEQGKFIMEYGYISKDVGNGILSFPEIVSSQEEFTFTYLHPGKYYITAVADMNKDGYFSKGDITSISELIEVKPKSKQAFVVEQIDVMN